MALADTVAHTTSHDSTFTTAGIAAWDGTGAHTIAHTGVVSGGIRYGTSTTTEDYSALLAANGVVVGGGAGAAPATVSGFTAQITGGLNLLQIQNATGQLIQIYSTGGGDSFIRGVSLTLGSANNIASDNIKNLYLTSACNVSWNGDVDISRAGANQIVFGGGTAGGGTATSRAEINKNVTAIADNVATATVTITVPNAAHSAGGKLIIKAAAGAGGAIGADEFSVENEYAWVVTRTAGVNAVATLTAIVTGVAASVAGGAAVTLTAAFSAISGAVGATNTFTLNVTIARGSGSSTNHTCFVYGTLLNDNASGATIV